MGRPLAIPEPARSVLDLARWAPSADNTQPWRFEVFDGHRFAVHFHDTRDHCVYDLDGHISQIAWGAMIETIMLAAGRSGCKAVVAKRPSVGDKTLVCDVTLQPDALSAPEPLAASITQRSTQRRAYRWTRLTPAQKSALEQSIAPGFRVIWAEGWRAKMQRARLLSLNGKLRLILPEAFETHRSVIEWNADRSEDRIPDRAVGLDPILLWVTRWAFGSWKRIAFLNRYLAGTLLARLELDVVPAMMCGAHFTLMAPAALRTMEDYVDGGRAVQRFWLTAESLGLCLQPAVSPLVFARYVTEQTGFTSSVRAQRLAQQVAAMVTSQIGSTSAHAAAVFAGRLGEGRSNLARSLRRPVEALLLR